MSDIVSHFDDCISVPEILFRPEFDIVIMRIRILWQITFDQTNVQQPVFCSNSIADLNQIVEFSDSSLAEWSSKCSSISINFSFTTIEQELYSTVTDEELTFEFITLRDWLIDIGCPQSLIYRITRAFVFDFTLPCDDIEAYQNDMRHFIFSSLEGLVLKQDFLDLETALFGDDFGVILQRMQAFCKFRLNNVPREECVRWNEEWIVLGYSYNIELYSNWQYDFEFEFTPVARPVFNFGTYSYNYKALIAFFCKRN